MKSPIIALALAGMFAPTLKGEELPLDVVSVLMQLEEFEEAERAKAEKVIADKRLQVAKFLEAALKRETKAGKLETALLIKQKIESLAPAKPVEKPALSGVAKDQDFIGEWTWFIADQKLILEKENKAFIQLPGGGAKLEAAWQAAGDSGRSIVVTWGQNEARIKFDAAFKTGDIKGTNGGNEFSAELKRIP